MVNLKLLFHFKTKKSKENGKGNTTKLKKINKNMKKNDYRN